jgi:uncharacterized membrane protein YdfJ with MMPL/SSD domain
MKLRGLSRIVRISDAIARVPLMFETFVMRSGLWVLSTTLGSVGVFCAMRSFSMPTLAAHALVLIGAALGINYCLNR